MATAALGGSSISGCGEVGDEGGFEDEHDLTASQPSADELGACHSVNDANG
jgi:hypothetical protein